MAKAAAKEIPVAVAQTASADATIEFTLGQEIETGDITQNSALSVIYDPARLPNIRNYHNGMPAWDISANLRFHPGLENYNGSVVQKTVKSGSTPVLRHVVFEPTISTHDSHVSHVFSRTSAATWSHLSC